MNLNRKETYPHPKILFIIKKYYYLYNYLTLLFENGFEKKKFHVEFSEESSYAYFGTGFYQYREKEFILSVTT